MSRTMRGGVVLGDHQCRPRFVGVVDMWKDALSGDGPYPSRVQRNHDISPMDNSCPAPGVPP